MTLLSRAKAKPLPEPTLEDHDYELWGQNVRADMFTADQLRAAREQIAAEGDAVIAKLCEALAAIVDADLTYFDGYVDRYLISYGKVQAARAALAEARKE